MRYAWILSVMVVGGSNAWAADGDGDGCDDIQYTANGACIADSASVDPTVTTVSGTFVGAEASVGPFVALDDVHISPRATLDGWVEHTTQPLTVGAGTVVGRQAVLGADHILGIDTTISRAVTAGARLTTGNGATVGYAAQLGTDVTIDANGTVGSLVALGNFTQVGASAVIARGTTIADSASSGAATTILGIVGPDVTIGADVLVQGTARVRKQATLLPGAQVLDGARVGRGATVEAGATVSGVVRANATVCAGGTLGATDVVSSGGTWPASGCSIEIVDNAGVLEWANGTYAASCDDYLNPGPGYSYAGATGDGLYRIDPTGSSPFTAYCDMTKDGGGWTRLFSSHYPTWWDRDNYEDIGSPTDDNYSALGRRSQLAVGGTYTLRLEVGNQATWNTDVREHFTVWSQGHDPFTQTTNGSDFQFIGGELSTTCSGFNGLHNAYYVQSGINARTSDVDSGDGVGCWWMQIVPLAQYSDPGSNPGYLEGYGGASNYHTWQSLWIR